ncbi:hypothetical protein CRH09_01545 [Nocardia terpenica]|uniref:Uncharacterized protein n=1 Tax=Nocardia terpenica TaxID=455432 RepID=A0A291RCQ6_9NOCA|nr:hypothetical protein CRH09_01545 [Nocardia terpenica]
MPLEQRVNLLFATIVDNDGVEVSTIAVAQALSQSLARPVAACEIEALRSPGAQRPSGDLLEGLARYFDMQESFLSNDPDLYYIPFRQLSLLIRAARQEDPVHRPARRLGTGGRHRVTGAYELP